MPKALWGFAIWPLLLTAHLAVAQQFHNDDRILIRSVVQQCLFESEKPVYNTQLCEETRQSIENRLRSMTLVWSEDYYAAIDAQVKELYETCFPASRTEVCQQLIEEIQKIRMPYKSVRR